MPARKLKPVEANDGSYAGLVLAAFDEQSSVALRETKMSAHTVHGSHACVPHGTDGKFRVHQLSVVKDITDDLRATGALPAAAAVETV